VTGHARSASIIANCCIKFTYKIPLFNNYPRLSEEASLCNKDLF
jgi:hypothetical protein